MIACQNIEIDKAIVELRPLKDEAISRKSMDFDGFESILSGFLLKSVHLCISAVKICTFCEAEISRIKNANAFGVSLENS